MITFVGKLKNLTQMFQFELYLISKNEALNNGIFTVNDCHAGVKESGCFFVDNIFNVEKGFKAIFMKGRKVLAKVGRTFN